MEKFVRFERARELFLTHWPSPLSTESVSLEEALGRTAALDHYARYDLPVVRASQRDGVAVSSERWNTEDRRDWILSRDFCRADTGDDFPDRFDAVVAIEEVTGEEGSFDLTKPRLLTPGEGVRPAGSLLARGELVLAKGSRIIAQDLAALSMGGFDRVQVVRKPRVAFVPTGSELVPVGTVPRRGENLEANGQMAKALLEACGARVTLHPIVKDRREQLEEVVLELLSNHDLVLLNGGSSKGEEDFNVRIQEGLGELIFHWSEAGPGRPVALARVGEKPVVVVPGPVYGAFNVLRWLVGPVLGAWQGRKMTPLRLRARLLTELENPMDFRFLYGAKISFREGEPWVKLVHFKKDGLLSCLQADGYVHAEVGACWKVGDWIPVTLLRK